MVFVGVMGGSFHASLRAPKSIYVSIQKYQQLAMSLSPEQRYGCSIRSKILGTKLVM